MNGEICNFKVAVVLVAVVAGSYAFSAEYHRKAKISSEPPIYDEIYDVSYLRSPPAR